MSLSVVIVDIGDVKVGMKVKSGIWFKRER